MCLDLIRAIYDGEIKLPTDSYSNSLKDLQAFNISPQVYILLRERGLLAKTPLFFQEQLKEGYTETLYKNLFIKRQTEQILKKFEVEEIDVIPLKGTIFAEKYFGHIGARATSDIDVLVSEGDVEKAIQLVKTLGFTHEAEKIPGHFHCSYSKVIPGSPLPMTVEIHWDLLKEETAEFCIEDLWRQAVPMNKHVKELSSYHTFYMICLHGWRHNLNSPKYFMDIVQLLHKIHDEIDYAILLKDAASHKTLKRIIRTLSIVYREFPHLEKLKPLPLKKKITLWELQSFKKGKERSLKQYIDFLDYQIFSYDETKHSLLEMRNWAVPRRFLKFRSSQFQLGSSMFTRAMKSLLKK